ncbi:MAG TPA: hypothetical protein VIT42_04880 [Microlunatus sp.]
MLVAIGAAAVMVLLMPRPMVSGGRSAGRTLWAAWPPPGLVEWSTSGRTADLGIALAQWPLVTSCLLAGWAIARRVGWSQTGIGPSAYLSAGRARPGCPRVRSRLRAGPAVGLGQHRGRAL